MTIATPRATFAAIAAIALASLLVGALYLHLIPPFENSDEVAHLAAIRHIASTASLPVVRRDAKVAFEQEGYQAPLYYLLAAPLAAALGPGPITVHPQRDPAFRFAPAPPGTGPHRMYVPVQEDSPEALRKLAVLCRSMRWLSLAWGLGATLLCASLAWHLSHHDPATTILSTAFFSFNPRWIEATASVSNDAAAACLGAAVLLQCVTVLRDERAITVGRAALFGVTCAAAVLTKLSLAALLPLAVAALAWRVATVDGLRRALALASVMVGVVALPLIPWLLRNAALYGDPLVTSTDLWRPFVATRRWPLSAGQFFAREFQGFRWSYWAVFGQFAILAHAWLYPLLDWLIASLGVAGLLATGRVARRLGRPRGLETALVPAAATGSVFLAFLSYTRWILASQGRLLYPTAAGVAFILASALLWLPPRLRLTVAGCGAVAMFALAVYVAVGVLGPAYGTL